MLNREHAQDAHMSDQALRIRERIAALQATNPTDEDPLAEARAEQAAEIRYADRILSLIRR